MDFHRRGAPDQSSVPSDLQYGQRLEGEVQWSTEVAVSSAMSSVQQTGPVSLTVDNITEWSLTGQGTVPCPMHHRIGLVCPLSKQFWEWISDGSMGFGGL